MMLKIFVIFMITFSTIVQASEKKFFEEEISPNNEKKTENKKSKDVLPIIPIQEGVIIPASKRTASLHHSQSSQITEKRIWGITDEQVNDLFDGTSGLFCLFSNKTMKFLKVSEDFIKLVGHSEETLYNELPLFGILMILKEQNLLFKALLQRNERMN